MRLRRCGSGGAPQAVRLRRCGVPPDDDRIAFRNLVIGHIKPYGMMEVKFTDIHKGNAASLKIGLPVLAI